MNKKKLSETNAAFFGMSVGASAATSWMTMSRANTIIIVDPDVIDPSNLNRLQYGFSDVGKRKIDVVKESLVKINPFSTVQAFTKIAKDKLKDIIFLNKNKPDIIIDEMDDFESKLQLRMLCKEFKIALISAADVGDMTILDIERYDSEEDTKPFLGKLGDLEKLNFKDMSEFEKKKLIIKLVGFEHNSERILESLMAIGGTITTWPQLGATAAMTGGITALTIKKIILGENVQSGRYFVSLDEILVKDFNEKEKVFYRQRLIKNINEILKI